MDEFNKIRKEFHVRKKSIYQIAREYNRSWETIKNIVRIPEHKIQLRGKRNSIPKVITPDILNKINEYLEFEVTHHVHKKQRFTSAFIFKKLKDEYGYSGSSKRIRTVVACARRELKLTQPKAFLELDFEQGKYLQVDHGEVDVVIGGQQIRAYLFVAAVPGTSLRFCQIYPIKSFESWGAFHEVVFAYYGGVFENIIYDNDSVLKNNQTNEETSFAIEMQIHYGFKAIYCNKAAGYEKGAVENSVGFCRRNFLAGLPSFDSLEVANSYLHQKCNNLLSEKHYISKRFLIDYFNEVKVALKDYLPGRSWGRWEDLKVSEFQQITFQDHAYSLPEKYVGAKLKVYITVHHIEIYDGKYLIITHERQFLEGASSLILDHYLDQLEAKPTAIAHAKIIKRQCFKESILNYWEQLKYRFGEKEGNLQFVKTLKLQRQSSLIDFNTAVELALSYHAISFDAVKSILKQLQIDQVRSIQDRPSLLKEENFNISRYSALQEFHCD